MNALDIKQGIFDCLGEGKAEGINMILWTKKKIVTKINQTDLVQILKSRMKVFGEEYNKLTHETINHLWGDRDDIPLEIGAFERKRLVFGLDPTRRGVGITVNWREFNHTRTERPLRIKYSLVECTQA